ncbi:unnamed protein product [Protopolystoma xenopodis]|uniref:Uncharacterized protein n=1 Tax=Protopolystoma xenopodis TaxID=117903 RepID=A0A3S5C4X6_9PLAT|nr:unnamed protein product [Protopolystoma xenopodis]
MEHVSHLFGHRYQKYSSEFAATKYAVRITLEGVREASDNCEEFVSEPSNGKSVQLFALDVLSMGADAIWTDSQMSKRGLSFWNKECKAALVQSG